MAIIVSKGAKVLVQGITGAQGQFHTKLMLDYGTRIVAGVTPGKGGSQIHNIPVYDTVKQASNKHGMNASIVFVPPPFAADAALEAIEAGLETIVIITEGIPFTDSAKIMAHARKYSVVIIGPNTPGIITPNSYKLGVMPASVFEKGKAGIVSRSGTLSYEVAARLTAEGVGQSTCLGIGGDPIVGLDFVDALKLFEKDEDTEGVVLIGEIGGDFEELAAEFISTERYPKPVVAYIAGGLAGRTLPTEVRMGHAGAIIWGNTGTAENKIRSLEDAGVRVASKVSDIPRMLLDMIAKSRK